MRLYLLAVIILGILVGITYGIQWIFPQLTNDNAASIGFIIFLELFYVVSQSKLDIADEASVSLNIGDKFLNNTKIIGNILYTDYFLLFQLSGIILLVAMIGAILLTLRKRSGAKKQNIHDQILRKNK